MGNRIAVALSDRNRFTCVDDVGLRNTDGFGDPHRFGNSHCLANTDRVPIADCLTRTRPCRIEWAKYC